MENKEFFYNNEIISICDTYHLSALKNEDGTYAMFSISIYIDGKFKESIDNTSYILETLYPYLKTDTYIISKENKDYIDGLPNKKVLLLMLEEAMDTGMLNARRTLYSNNKEQEIEDNFRVGKGGSKDLAALDLHCKSIKKEVNKVISNQDDKAQRFNEGKLDWTLVDYPSIEPLVEAMTYGKKKYSRDNWKKQCDNPKQHLQSAMRHLISLIQGEEVDSESKVNHLGHIMANMMMYNYQNNKK